MTDRAHRTNAVRRFSMLAFVFCVAPGCSSDDSGAPVGTGGPSATSGNASASAGGNVGSSSGDGQVASSSGQASGSSALTTTGAGGSTGGTVGGGTVGGGAGGSSATTSAGGASTTDSSSTTGGAGGVVQTPQTWISFDPETVVSRSNVILESPNGSASQFMPLGNGPLGAAAWASNGLTVQINRIDTMPDRKSLGRVNVPGLSTITTAGDYQGTLDLYNGVFVQSGGGMTARTYIRADKDQLVVDVTGADPASNQTASVSLWSGRSPQAAADGAVATLSETWSDGGTWSSNQQFGTLAALTAGGRNVTASANGSTATVTFQPNDDGSFRVICGAPKFNASMNASELATQILGDDPAAADLESGHNGWWHDFWGRVGLMKLSSDDGRGEYYENLRALFLFAHASESRGEIPGSQAGVADLFNFDQDTADWYPAAYWFWNLRMQVAAAETSGAPELNDSSWNLYTSNLSNIQEWTDQRMGGRPGICVPETMRFNGNGWWYDSNHACDLESAPSYNALTLSTGVEISLMMWEHYLMTLDEGFLEEVFPFMTEAVRFLLDYATVDSDGLLTTSPSNAHENQWSVTNPMGDIIGMRAFFPAFVEAAGIVGSTDALIAEVEAAIPQIRDIPRTNTARNQVTTSASDDTNIFAYSMQPTAELHNVENNDLEPVWPYNLVSDENPTEFQVALRTYGERRNSDNPDWSNDAIIAARLGLADEVPARLSAIIDTYQVYPSGFAAFTPSDLTQPYIEAIGVLSTAINEAVATGFDGTIRLAPALPDNWSVSGTVYVHGLSRVHVHFVDGQLAFGVLEAGSTGAVKVKNPFGTEAVVIDHLGQEVVVPTADDTLTFNAETGSGYLIKRSQDPVPDLVEVTGIPASSVKTHGSRTIGVR